MISINSRNIINDKGFSIQFENGWTVSVQIGMYTHGKEGGIISNPYAEIAAFKDEVWYDFGDNEIKGFCKPDEILEFMNLISNKK